MKSSEEESSVACRIRTREKSSVLALVGIAILIILCLSGCGNQSVTAQVSWAEHYTSLKELKQHSDFVVSGNITQIGDAVQPADGSMVYSDVTLTVDKVVWNAHANKTVPSTIHFHENGGIAGSKTYIVEDDPLYQTDQHVILFFTEYSPGKYRVTSGPTGRFLIDNQQVTPIDPNVKLTPNTDEDTFIKNIEAAN